MPALRFTRPRDWSKLDPAIEELGDAASRRSSHAVLLGS
jgi:hypothetical protein